MFTSARIRVTNFLEELEQREARGNQPITKQELEDKINIWMIKCEEMKQHIHQYKTKELLIIPENELMGKMEDKMEAAEWEEVEGESPTGYLAEIEPIKIEEEFNIYQMTDWNEEIEENITQEKIDEILNEF